MGTYSATRSFNHQQPISIIMKKTILALCLAAAATATLANGSRNHSDKPSRGGHNSSGPDHCAEPRTPPTKPDKPEPKSPPSSGAPSSRSGAERSEGSRDAANLCTRWPTMLFCDRP